MAQVAKRRLMGMVTHHKCGTIWMKKIILGLSRILNVPVFGVWSDRYLKELPESGDVFLVNWEGYVPEALWTSKEYKSVHLIRDPRDVLLSGCQYHHFAPQKGEKFLHEDRDDLGGMSYQNYLCSLESYEDKLTFEMNEKHHSTLNEMLKFPRDKEQCLLFRYENLLVDREMVQFEEILSHWDIPRSHYAAAKQIIWNASLFGSLADPKLRRGRMEAHILSGDRARWKKELPRSVGKSYAERFGPALRTLGYEKDDTWVDGLDVDPNPFNLPQPPEDAAAHMI